MATFRSTPKPAGISDLEHQLRRFHSFLWVSGGAFNDFFIHIIDGLCWMKETPGEGGRAGRAALPHAEGRGALVDQNFDAYAVEYTYADGAKLLNGRKWFQQVFSSHMLGSGAAIVSSNSDCGAPWSSPPAGLLQGEPRLDVKDPEDQTNPYQNEWNDFIAAIRDGRPYNEAKYGVETRRWCAAWATSAASTGVEVSYKDLLECKHEFRRSRNSRSRRRRPCPRTPRPVPGPGVVTDREY